jgi:hypothetical protein
MASAGGSGLKPRDPASGTSGKMAHCMFAMIENRRQQAVLRPRLGQKAESDPSALLAVVGTGLAMLAFGAVWFAFLRGLTALGRLLTVWHFYI